MHTKPIKLKMPALQQYIFIIVLLACAVLSQNAGATCIGEPPPYIATSSSGTPGNPLDAGMAANITIFYSSLGGNGVNTFTTSSGANFVQSYGCTDGAALAANFFFKETSNSDTFSTSVSGTQYTGGSFGIAAVPDPKNLGDKTCPCTIEGEPINAATGNLFEEEDSYVPASTLRLDLKLYYNSQANNATPFGMYWRSTYDRSIYNGPGSTQASVYHQNGRVDIFNLVGGVWTSDPDVTITLTPVMSGGVQVGWQVVENDDSIENFNIAGQLTSIVTRAGLMTSLTYNTSNQLTTVTGPFGQTLTYTYTTAGNVYQVTQPDSGVLTYAYDTNNNLISVTYPDTTSRQYAYTDTSNPHALTSITDENGHVYASFTYDSGNGRALTSQLAGGVGLTSIVYHANIFGVYEADVTAPNGYTHTYNLSSYYGSVKPDSMSGAPIPSVGGSAFYYDSNGFLRRWDDYNGNQTRFSFNSRGLDTYREEAYGTAIERDISTTWSTSWRLPTQIVEPLRTTNFTYDTTGNMLTRSVVAGGNTRTWTYTYNTNGQVLTADGPRTDISDVTTYTYDTHGNIATITDALSHVTSFTSYDANGRPLSITDPNGLVTTLTYDARGRLLTSTAGTELTSYTYDNAGNLTKITRPDSSYLSYAYDNAHRLTGISDILGNSIAYTLDNAGNKTAIKVYDPSSTLVRTRTFTYDNINDLLTMIGASSQTTTYGHDSNGNLTSVIDPLTHETDYSYDALNRISTSTDANSAETHLAYNANNDITSIEDPRSLTTTYTVDGLSNVTNIASPDTGSTAKTYDAAGNVITSTDARSDTTTYTYDALNRRTGATYADSTSVSWTYDQGTYGKGHLTTMVDLVGTSTWTYNIHGSVTQKQQAIGSVTLTTGFSYDSYGRLSTITYPSGRTATYSYNTAGQVSGVTTGSTALLSSVTYMPFGPVSGWTEGSGAPHARSFDLDGRLTGIVIGSTPTVPTVATQTYGYDTASRITSLTETSLADKGFSYDDVNRLTNLTIGTGSTAISTDYAYDDDSNRTTTTIAAGTTSYNYPSGNNKLSTLSGLVSVTYSYDAAGNMTADGTNSWSYGANGRMSSVTIGSTTTTYGINGLGQRIKKVGAGVLPSGTRQFVYNLQGQLLGEYDGSGNMLKETVWLGSLPVALMVGTGTSAANYYINPDNLTSPHIITDTTGNQVWNWDKLAFGDNAPNQNPSGLGTFYYHPRFPGQYADAESGLNYNMARDYNPALGRYIESDPLGLFAGINTYAYASNSPINIDDPYGLDCPSDLNPLNPDNPIQMASNDTNWQDKFVGAVDTLATRLGQGVGGGTGGTLAPAAKAIDQAQKLRQNLDDSSSAANSMYGQDIQTQSNIVDQQLNKFYPNQPK